MTPRLDDVRPSRWKCGTQTLFVLAVQLCLCLAVAIAPARAVARTVVVGVYDNAPKVFVDETGKPAGIFIDVIESIANLEGWRIEYLPGTWTEGLDRLARGEIDLMPDVAYSAVREETYDFPEESVLSSWFQVYARKGSGIRSLLDLADKSVLVLERSVQQAAFENLADDFKLKVVLMPAEDYGDMFQRVADGTADAAITNGYYGLRHAKLYGLEDTAIIFQPTQLYFAAARGKNADLLQALDQHMLRLREDQNSAYYASLKKWTAQDAPFFVPEWVKYVGVAIAAALLIALLGSFRLKQLVDARTRQLRESQQQLLHAQKMEAIGSLAAGIAHDFNNMLAVIMGYSSMLLRHDAPPPDWERTINYIHDAGKRASVLTRQLLAFSRKQILQPRIIDLNEELRETGELLKRLIGEQIDLTIKLDPDAGKVEADPGQMQQILMNLTVNARDAMPHGGKLTIETGNVVLDETYASAHKDAQPGPHVMLAVTDSGEGMSAETLSRIFEPFYTTKGVGKGTGLGLSTVYGIVKQSGGNIWVYSELGHGTTFKVYLPRVDKTVDTKKPAAPALVRTESNETILVIEDDPALRELLCEVLEIEGYRVLQAADTDEGAAIFNQYPGQIGLLLTDVIVPTIGGAELAKELRAIKPSLRVLYMSGYTDDAISHQGVLDPGVCFLEKPFLPDTLLEKVAEVLSKE